MTEVYYQPLFPVRYTVGDKKYLKEILVYRPSQVDLNTLYDAVCRNCPEIEDLDKKHDVMFKLRKEVISFLNNKHYICNHKTVKCPEITKEKYKELKNVYYMVRCLEKDDEDFPEGKRTDLLEGYYSFPLKNKWIEFIGFFLMYVGKDELQVECTHKRFNELTVTILQEGIEKQLFFSKPNRKIILYLSYITGVFSEFSKEEYVKHVLESGISK